MLERGYISNLATYFDNIINLFTKRKKLRSLKLILIPELNEVPSSGVMERWHPYNRQFSFGSRVYVSNGRLSAVLHLKRERERQTIESAECN